MTNTIIQNLAAEWGSALGSTGIADFKSRYDDEGLKKAVYEVFVKYYLEPNEAFTDMDYNEVFDNVWMRVVGTA